MDGIKIVLELFGKIVNLWWLWVIITVLGIWKFVDLVVIAVHHFKFT